MWNSVMHTSCTRHAHFMHTACTRHAHVMHTSCTQQSEFRLSSEMAQLFFKPRNPKSCDFTSKWGILITFDQSSCDKSAINALWVLMYQRALMADSSQLDRSNATSYNGQLSFLVLREQIVCETMRYFEP